MIKNRIGLLMKCQILLDLVFVRGTIWDVFGAYLSAVLVPATGGISFDTQN